jgi:sigma-B regulation protein RsbU (phosphoserine phosphatase)
MATIIDPSSSRRITLLTQLMEEMTRVKTPGDVVDVLSRGFQQAAEPVASLHLSTRGLEPGQFRIHRLATPGGGEHVAATDPWHAATLPVHSGGFFAQLVRGSGPVIVHDLDLSRDPVVGHALAPYRSLVAAPTLDPELPINWVLLLHEQPEHFQVEDLEELILRANLVGAITKGLKTSQELAAANLRIAREIEQIARIQKTLLPSQLPEIPGLSIAAHFDTFDRAGGDLYDVAPLARNGTPDDRWAILIADASGHGPAAATVCAMLNSILHAYPRNPKGPAEVLRYVNRHLCNKQIESSFVTAFLAFYEPGTRRLTYSRAGHNPPVVLAPFEPGESVRGLAHYLDGAAGLPLGIDGDAPFGEESVTLDPGQLVLLYTDGITEAKSPAGELFGIEGLEAALARCPDGPDLALRCVTQALAEHQGTWRPSDDQTLLAIQTIARS